MGTPVRVRQSVSLSPLSLGFLSLPSPVLPLPLSVISECCGHGRDGSKRFGARGITLCLELELKTRFPLHHTDVIPASP